MVINCSWNAPKLNFDCPFERRTSAPMTMTTTTKTLLFIRSKQTYFASAKLFLPWQHWAMTFVKPSVVAQPKLLEIFFIVFDSHLVATTEYLLIRQSTKNKHAHANTKWKWTEQKNWVESDIITTHDTVGKSNGADERDVSVRRIKIFL